MPDLKSVNPVLDEKWLKRASWWVNHRELLRNVAVGSILVIDVILLAYSAYGWADYWIFSRNREETMIVDLTKTSDLSRLHGLVSPQPLPPPTVIVLPGSAHDGKYDVLVKFVNPNPKWLVDVRFSVPKSDGSEPTEQTVTILNDDELFFIAPGAASSSSGGAAVTILGQSWRRLRIPNDLNERKPKFLVSDVQFLSGPELKLAGDLNLNQVRFRAKNDGVYGYWTINFAVVLLSGESAVAADITSLDRFGPGEERAVSINLYSTIPAITKVLVVPQVNVSDETIFMNVPGKPIQF